jgi:hypothetical protein
LPSSYCNPLSLSENFIIKPLSRRGSLISIIAIGLVSCRPLATVAPKNSGSSSLQLTITANNLSENLTGNDEIFIIGYQHNDSLNLGAALFWKKFEFTRTNFSQRFQSNYKPNGVGQSLILFLIEQDSEIPFERIEPSIRLHCREILKEFRARNYSGIELYLGDDDVLGYKVIPPMDCYKPVVIEIAGIYKLDRYEYLIKVECY